MDLSDNDQDDDENKDKSRFKRFTKKFGLFRAWHSFDKRFYFV